MPSFFVQHDFSTADNLMASDPERHEGEGIQDIEGQRWWWFTLVAAGYGTQQVGINTAADLVCSTSM